MADTADKVVKIKVIGVGGAGNNVINRMIASDVKGVELGHHGNRCSFDAFIDKYRLDADPALAAIHQRLRQAFDPAGILNPGRVMA